MHCPSCGEQIPDNSVFCHNCGKPTGASSSSQVTAWENQDYSWHFPQFSSGWRLTAFYSPSNARLDIWQRFQDQIMVELRKWLDQGWEPVGEIGPSAIKLGSYEQNERVDLDLMGVILFFATFGIMFLVWLFSTTKWTYVVPTEFRVPMRRPKR